jgi:hypothetical protein
MVSCNSYIRNYAYYQSLLAGLGMISFIGRLLRITLALIAGLFATSCLVVAWQSSQEGNRNEPLTYGAGAFGLLLFLLAFTLWPRGSTFNRPTQKQLDFAKHLGIETKGKDKWMLSDAIDDALQERETRRK